MSKQPTVREDDTGRLWGPAVIHWHDQCRNCQITSANHFTEWCNCTKWEPYGEPVYDYSIEVEWFR